MPQTYYKVLIPTSGVGVPLGELTNYTNKSLIKVGKKPTLSYIIDSYPKDTEFVITLGHFGDHVKDFIKLAHPSLNVAFISVDKYKGEGNSLAYSMLQAESLLQTPFIYHVSDTIVMEEIQHPEYNWVAGFKAEGSSKYASFDVIDGSVRHMYDKGTLNPDFLHIGLAGIKDFEQFWKILHELYLKHGNDEGLGDVHAIRKMIDAGFDFKIREFKKWYDVGNIDSLGRVRAEIPDSFKILDKLEESTFMFDDCVIKFFHDEKMVEERVERAELLKDVVPPLEGYSKNFYCYKYIPGELYANVATPANFRLFLEWTKNNLWKKEEGVSDEEFKKVCLDFYQTKTLKRVNKLLESRGVKDEGTVINEEVVPSLMEILEKVDFDWLSQGLQMRIHGDFILDNIIKTDNGYCLLDWRQNFGGLIKSGDMYYDLAKLNHNLTVNHEIINNNLFTINAHGNNIKCDILRKENLVQCQNVLFEFLNRNGYDIKKVKILTAIVWLNMSPLHHHPFDLFLFYFGKLNLWRAMNQ